MTQAHTPEEEAPHPRGLYVLFATEMWERFSFYGMRALLMLYLVNQIGWAPKESSSVYKWYTSLVYLTPLLGGFLADRYLGLRSAILLGGVLMAVGHFLMAFEQLPFFFTALGFLIVGNGFFKPNISTLVGKMYAPNDARKDRAFTIFYMGINLGAFLSPLVCGWLRQRFGYAYGFGAAGVGMVLGLLTFLLGQKRVLSDVHAAGNDVTPKRGSDKASQTNDQDEQSSQTPGEGGFAGVVSKILPALLVVAALGITAQYVYLFIKGEASPTSLIMPIAFGAIAIAMARALGTLEGAARDKSVVIFAAFVFAVFFWMAYEQAGNALNLWAEFHTRLNLGSFEYPAEWFQSVNALFIVVLAPPFAALWLWLSRRGQEPSSPAKMLAAMVIMALSFVAMVASAASENGVESRAPLAALPQGLDLTKVAAGRMRYDAEKKELIVRGVLPPYSASEALEPAVDPAYVKVVGKLQKGSENASDRHPFSTVLAPLPKDFVIAFQGEDAPRFDPTTNTITVVKNLTATQKTALYSAAAPPELRAAVSALAERSHAARVSGLWLMLSYLLATLAELCISPVGLSMVTKLAPARFASLFMGVWLLANSLAQYVGGTLGELWGTIPPSRYFMIFVYTSIAGALLLVVLVKPLKKLMHGVT